MSDLLIQYGIATYVSQDSLVVPLQVDGYVEVIAALKDVVLNAVHANPNLKGLILDVSQLVLLDLHDMDAFESLFRMVGLFKVRTVLVGVQPAVALALVDLGYHGRIKTALTLERAIEQIQRSHV